MDQRVNKYSTVYLDPPWNETGGGKIKRGADRHYNLMKTPDIIQYCKKEILPMLSEDCHCYLWVTNNFLKDGLLLMNEMGFRYVTNIVWVKDRIGLGQYFRGQHEICLFGVKGKFVSNSRQQTTVIMAIREKHSKKPEGMYKKIEAVSNPPYLEVFARQTRYGWEAIGNEIDNKEKQYLLCDEIAQVTSEPKNNS